MSNDCETCGGDLTGTGGLPCSCPKDTAKKRKSTVLPFKQRRKLIDWLEELVGDTKKLEHSQRVVAEQATEVLGFQINAGHVQGLCQEYDIKSYRKVNQPTNPKSEAFQVLKAEFEEFKEQVGEDLREIDKDVSVLKEKYGTIFKAAQEAGINVPI